MHVHIYNLCCKYEYMHMYMYICIYIDKPSLMCIFKFIGKLGRPSLVPLQII